MGIPSGWHYDTPGEGWEAEWNDAQSRGPTGSGDGVTYYRSGKGSEFALDYQSDTAQPGWGSTGIAPQYQSLLASAGSKQRGLLHGRNIAQGQAAPPAAPENSRPAPTLNTAAIAEAKHRADAFKIGATPKLATTGNPFTDAAEAGDNANKYFTGVTDYFNGQAGLAATEMGEAGKYYTNRFIGKVPAVMSPEQIRDQFSWYKGQIA